MSYQIISIHEKEKWISYVSRAFSYDFYHSWQYHSTEKEGDPFLFVYEEADTFIIIPLVKRKIADSDLFDLTSAYGYLGPLSNKSFMETGEQMLDHFKQAFLQFLKAENIVCLFSRLHPIIEQTTVLKKIGGLHDNGNTVFIDLHQSPEQQRKQYRKSVSNSISALRHKNPVVTEIATEKDLKIFVDIYTENMKRINANEGYYFDEAYFTNLINSKEFKVKALLMHLDNEPIAGGFFVYTNDIIEVHLLATRTNYLHLSPTKLLIDEASIIGREAGMKYLHLGGGVGGQNDSLFFWKSGFSNTSLSFQTWRFINDQAEYDSLVKKHTGLTENKLTQSNYFPLYRSLIAS